MTTRISLALYDQTGAPKADAVPVFLEYRAKTGTARTPPAIVNLGGGVYGFTPTEADERAGIAFVVSSGAADVLPLLQSDVVHADKAPFAAVLLTDALGAVWTGAAPTIGVYKDFQGNVRTPPALVALSGAYFFALVPTTADLNAGVVFRVDSPAGATPAFWTGGLTLTLAVLSTTKQQVLDRFPELAGDPELSELVWNEVLFDVGMEIPVASWLSQDAADRAALWLAAHMVAIERRRASSAGSVFAPGPLQSVTVGPVTKTFATRQDSSSSKTGTVVDEMLSQTEYGREYMRLRVLYCRSRR